MRLGKTALFTWRSAITDPAVGPAGRPGLVSRQVVVHVAVTGLSLHMSPAGGDCWPSVRRIAAETGLHERTVQRAVDVLVAGGWLRVRRGGGRGRSNHYEVAFPRPVWDLVNARFVDDGDPSKKGGSVPPFSQERVAVSHERVAVSPVKGGGPPPEFFMRSSRGPSAETTAAASADVVSLADFRARRASASAPVATTEEWVRVWWWARARGEQRTFPQIDVDADDVLSDDEYVALRDAWQAEGSPEVFDPSCLLVGMNFSVTGARGSPVVATTSPQQPIEEEERHG